MKKIFKGIGVDAGIILIGDLQEFFEENIKTMNKNIFGLIRVATLKNGHYNVKVKTKTMFQEDVECSGTVNVTSGSIIIADPSYITKDENWLKYLDNCEMTHFKKEGMIIDNMGGDGMYNLEVEFIKK